MASQALTTQPSGSVPARDNSPHGQFKRQIMTRQTDFAAALRGKGIRVENFLSSIWLSVAKDPELLKADRSSLIFSCLKAADDGLSLDGREATLVIFNQRYKDGGQWKSRKTVQYMPMVYGLRKKILQAKDANGQPVVSALQVGVVYRIEVEQGYFRWERGTDPEVQHRPMLEITEDEARDENIVAAYSIATMADGTKSYEVMRRFEINKVRQMSQTGAEGQVAKYDMGDIKRGDPIPPKGPWVDWFAEMAKKTVMRRHAKTLPMSSDVIAQLGGDDDEILAGETLERTLSGTVPDAPQLIDGSLVDGDGVIIEGGDQGGDQDAADDSGQAKAEATSAKPARGKAKQDPPAGNDIAPEALGGEDDDDSARELAERRGPAEDAANKLLGEFGEAKSGAALEKLWSGSALDRAAMPDDIHEALESGYNRHRKRLGLPALEAEPAE